MNNIRLLNTRNLILRILYPRCYTSLSNILLYPVHRRGTIISTHYLNVSKSAEYFSNCSSMQTKHSDTAIEKNNSDKVKKIVEDEEFQNILNDFANDFGVDKETNHLLEDIRKNINDDKKGSNLSRDTNLKRDNITSVLGIGLDYKYKEFSEADSKVIPSFEDKNFDLEEDEIYHIDQELRPKPYSNLQRGITGVFDIDDLIQVLRNENMFDIATLSMLTDSNDSSCDFFVLVTARSQRHCEAVAESLLKLYKKKKNERDPFITVEGERNSGWRVIDMGNIVLHMFLEEVRAKYDVESCQLFDSQFDTCGNIEPDPMLHIIEEQMEFFNSLQESNSPEVPKDIS